MKSSRSLRFSVLLKIIGWLLLLEASIMIVPLLTSVFYGERDWLAFLIAFGATALAGGTLALVFRRKQAKINSREGFLLTTLVWVFFSFFGMIPFMLSATHLDFTDAFFETMSGFTTTGASVIGDVESCPRGLLLWRAMSQWIGGLGIILFILAVLPSLDQSGGISMLNAEISGISYGKLHPRIRKTAASLWKVYVALTGLLIVLLWIGPLDFFESVCQAFSTMSTGGFSTNNQSIGGFHSVYTGIVITVFMFLGGVNLALLYGLSQGDWRSVIKNTVFRGYCVLIGATYLLVLIYMIARGEHGDAVDWVLNPMFHILSSLTTTGFSYDGFAIWGAFGLMITLILMFIGACAGSTTGASKVDRIIVLVHHLKNEIVITLHPNHLKRVALNGQILPTSRISRIVAFLSIEICIIAGATIVFTFFDLNFSDALFATVTAIGNNGLGYGATATTFALLPDAVKWIMALLMLIGRLEIFTVLVVFTKSFWSHH